MKRMGMMLAIAGLVTLIGVQDLMAQRRAGGRRGGLRGSIAAQLLAMEKVQKELDISDEQKELIEEFQNKNRDMQSEFREMLQEAQEGGDRQELQEKFQELRSKIQKEMSEIETKIMDGMKDSQRERFHQLRFQLMSRQNNVALLQDDEAKKLLEITDEQSEKIESAMQDFQDERREAIEEMRDGGDRQEFMQSIREAQEVMNESVMGVLSEEQTRKLEEIKGEKFEFPQRQRRRQGRNDF